MSYNFQNTLKKCILNIPGWRSDRKIVVFESDDWGSIRMPSKKVYEKCLKSGYPVDKNAYERYDSLMSKDDLELLFDLLSGFRDRSDNPPVMTINCVVANPDFEKIEQYNFEKYYFEPVTDTFSRYPKHEGNFKIWQNAMESKLIFPQFHAREHLNVSLFMDALKRKDADVIFGFNNRMPGCIPGGAVNMGNSYVEATNYSSIKDKDEKLSIYLDGLDLFKKLFGFNSDTIIPPNFIWSPDFNKPVKDKGVLVFQGIRKMGEPSLNCKFRYHSFHMGKMNDLGQINLVRNSVFEPSLLRLQPQDMLNRCLSDMQSAFMMSKPAIISCHRINYVGYIDEKNRDTTLKLLRALLTIALRKWPDIEFMSSSQLGRIILNHKQNLS